MDPTDAASRIRDAHDRLLVACCRLVAQVPDVRGCDAWHDLAMAAAGMGDDIRSLCDAMGGTAYVRGQPIDAAMTADDRRELVREVAQWSNES